MESGDWVTAAAPIRERAMATAVELDDSHAGDNDRTRHELSPPLIVPRRRGRRRRRWRAT